MVDRTILQRSLCSCAVLLVLFAGTARAGDGSLAVADDLLVDLSAADFESGGLEWPNNGSAGGQFLLSDEGAIPRVDSLGSPAAIDIAGARAVNFNATGSFDAFVADFNTPEGLTGIDPTRSIEAWVYNVEIANEETILSWGGRGGPAGSNMSFNYGTNGEFGAVGHWGAPDIGWAPGGGAPVAGEWHHLVYTFDGSTTRVYADGCLVDENDCASNTEELGFGVINTNPLGPIVIAAQQNGDGSLNVGLAGTLAIGQVRIHDGVLSDADVLNNFEVEVDSYIQPSPCACTDCPESDSWIPGGDYVRTVTLVSSSLSPITDVRISSPDGAIVDFAGRTANIFYTPPEDSEGFTITLECENSVGVETFSWEVTRPAAPPEIDPDLHVAGELIVNLCADHESAGTNLWVSGGSVQAFGLVPGSNPIVEEIDGVTAVTFSNDIYVSDVPAPPGLVGANADRTIEVWAYNPDAVGEETMVAWGARGGPNGSNMSFNYGNHPTFGAVGHWGAPDIGWNDAGGNPDVGFWHHLVYTFDGTTTRVYSDGILQNQEVLGAGVINTKDPYPIVIGGQNEDNGTQNLNAGFNANLSIAKVRVHDGVLSAQQIFENYNVECGQFQGNCLTQLTFPTFVGEFENDSFCPGQATYTFRFIAEGSPPPVLSVVSPEGATIDENGLFSYNIPSPSPASFEVEVAATNEVGTANAGFTVERQEVDDEIQTAGDVFVDVDAENLAAGIDEFADDFWVNDGEAGDLERRGEPVVVEIAGVKAVQFNSAGVGDSYVTIDPAPEGLTGPDADRTIEVWVYNEAPLVSEETILSWGRRGGGPGTNMSFNYGTNAAFGAVGHWDAPDIGWSDAGGAPAAGVWHHLAYTFDGTTTRVYADGELANSEELGAGVINTHPEPQIALAQQWEGDGLTFNGGLFGTLALAKVRIHDGVLSPCQIQKNYELESGAFGNAPEFTAAPESGTFCASVAEYSATVQVTGTPVPSLSINSLEGATISANGVIVVPIPDPAPESFEVEIEASNDVGSATASWTVSRQDIGDGLILTDLVFVDLDVRDLDGGQGAGPDLWPNNGTLGDFQKIGDPQVVTRTNSNSLGMSFNQDGRAGDAYQATEPTPIELLGPDPQRTIEIWVHNPDIPGEETMVSWGRRGGPDGTNMSFNYGNQGQFGAVGHWGGGGPDLGWIDNTFTTGAPEADVWHHLAYTYDGTTTRVYADGELWNSEVLGAGVINTHPEGLITLAQQIEPDGVSFTGALQGTLTIARVRIMGGVLSDCDIATNYEVEKQDFEAAPCPVEGDADYADTHCLGLEVVETGRPFGVTHELTATATDDTGDQIFYTFTIDDGINAPQVIGPRAEPTLSLALAPRDYTFSVTVDDRFDCEDTADDATCVFDPGGGDEGVGFIRGDVDGNGQLLLNDSIQIFGWLFQGAAEPGCVAAADASGQGQVNLTSGIYGLNFLFTGGPPPPAPFPECAKSEDPADLGLGCSTEQCP